MSHYFATGEVPRPQGSGTAMIVPYEAFPVVRRLGDDRGRRPTRCSSRPTDGARRRPSWPRDPRFVDNPRRVEHRVALQEALAAGDAGA